MNLIMHMIMCVIVSIDFDKKSEMPRMPGEGCQLYMMETLRIPVSAMDDVQEISSLVLKAPLYVMKDGKGHPMVLRADIFYDLMYRLDSSNRRTSPSWPRKGSSAPPPRTSRRSSRRGTASDRVFSLQFSCLHDVMMVLKFCT